MAVCGEAGRGLGALRNPATGEVQEREREREGERERKSWREKESMCQVPRAEIRQQMGYDSTIDPESKTACADYF